MDLFSQVANAFGRGGLYMWFILCLQVISVGIILERFMALYKGRRASESDFSHEFEELIRKGDFSAVREKLDQVDRKSHPLVAAIETGISSAQGMGGKDEIQGKMDEVLLEENTKLGKRTGFLPCWPTWEL